jgi:hypothetical protein
VTRNQLTHLLLGGAVFLAGCSSSNEPTPNPPVTDCSEVGPTSIAVGAHEIVDAAETACIRLPAAGAGGAEYLYVTLSADGQETENGSTADYQLQGDLPPAAGMASQAHHRRGLSCPASRA